jgi:uncharacterized protein YndB with AHSA1/START domain
MLPDQVLSIDIHVPVEKVWHEITKTGAIQRAVNNCILEGQLKPGTKLRYYSPSKKRVFVIGEVVEFNPPSRFSHTWKFTMGADDFFTLVTWDLSPIAGGTRVRLTHSRWLDTAKTYKNVATTWAEILRLLKLDLETGDIDGGTKLKYFMFGALEFMLPKSTTVDSVSKQGY